jgi:hypothetical protein
MPIPYKIGDKEIEDDQNNEDSHGFSEYLHLISICLYHHLSTVDIIDFIVKSLIIAQ